MESKTAVTLLVFSLLVLFAYTQDLPYSQGKGTDHCQKCGNSSNNMDLPVDGSRKFDISRCALVKGGTSLADSIFECECRTPMYVGDGYTCDNFNECANSTDNCDNNAECIDTEGGFECECKEGFAGNGVVCSDFDECGNYTYVESHNHTHNPCGDSGLCINSVGSYSCDCKEGFRQVLGTNNTECEDINECLDSNLFDCRDNSHCVNLVPSNLVPKYECPCDKGYTADVGGSCVDVDECTVDTDACGANSNCANTIGNYNCTCDKGFVLTDGAEFNGDCRDIDECKEDPKKVCNDKFRKCNNTAGSAECVCMEGFTEKSGECKNTDECLKNPCDANALCTDTVGNYTCECKPGFTGNGFDCTDVDECKGVNDCYTKFARCINEPGTYSCQCVYGYTGSGKDEDCASVGDDLEQQVKDLSRVQAVIKVHQLENERQQLEVQHEALMRRCDKQALDRENKAAGRSRRDTIAVNDEAYANAEIWIVTLQSYISNLKLEIHALELSCPVATAAPK